MNTSRLLPLVAILALLAPNLRGQGPAVRPVAEAIPGRYNVALAQDDDPLAVGLESQSLFQGRLLRVFREALPGFSIQLPPGAAEALARDPRVLFVEEDGLVRTASTQSSPPWGLDRIDQPLPALDGRYDYPAPLVPVFVHVIDTGILETHVDFGGRAVISGDFVDDDGDGDPDDIGNDDGDPARPDGLDCNGHGSHVAGTIAGTTYGVAKSAAVHAYRAFDCEGTGLASSVIAALDAIVADGRRPAVVNMSLAGGGSLALDNAVRRVIAAGMTVVVAAGSGGADAEATSPARVTEAITVGAIDQTDAKPGFSNFGPLLDIFAPGVGILSSYHTSDTATAVLSGTSTAAAHVAGVAALYMGQTGDRAPQEVGNALVATATAGPVTNGGTGSPNLLLFFSFAEASLTESTASITGSIASITGSTNVAAAASGATVTASSTYSGSWPAGAVINGDRRGAPYGGGGTWSDATGGVYPDWVEVAFAGAKTIGQIDVFGLQDATGQPVEPTPGLGCTGCGLKDFTLQYWSATGWQTVPGGAVQGNTQVWRTFTFAPVTTGWIRVLVEGSQDGWSQMAEIEAYESTGGGNTPPTVSLTSPTNGTSTAAPGSFTLAATASDVEGPVTSVTFYANGGVLLGTATTSPFSLPWTGVGAGTYALTAVATDGGGLSTTSAAVNVTVTGGSGGTVNVAAAASGATVTASSTYSGSWPAGAVINGDRRGAPYGGGGTWADATPGVYPDWVEVAFAGAKTIGQIDVFGLQDATGQPVEPTPGLGCTGCGLRDFTLQYWGATGWQTVPGGTVQGNTQVWRTFTFAPVTTGWIRVLVQGSQDGWSQIAEIEAYASSGGPPPTGEWFVAPGASGNGSSSSPFGKIQQALDVAQPGQTITVLPGTYNESLATARAGLPGQPIVLRSAGGRGSVLVTTSGRVLTVIHAHFAVEGLILDGQYGTNDLVRVDWGGHYFRLSNSELRRTSRDLVDMLSVDGVVIENSLLHHALNWQSGRQDAHGIVGAAVRNLVVRDCEIHTFSGDGLQFDPARIAPGWDGVTVERTHIWLEPLPVAENGFPAGVAPGENAIDTKASTSFPRSTMVLRDIVAHGFRNGLITNMAAFNLKEYVDVTVERVTVFDSEIAFRLRGVGVAGGAWVAIQNAVVYDVLTAFRYEDTIQNLRIWNSTVGGSVTNLFQAAASPIGAGMEVRNLLVLGTLSVEAASHWSNLGVSASAFTNAAGHDYTLAPGSPAIDAALPLPQVTVDRLFVPRPQGQGPDIGAYERP